MSYELQNCERCTRRCFCLVAGKDLTMCQACLTATINDPDGQQNIIKILEKYGIENGTD